MKRYGSDGRQRRYISKIVYEVHLQQEKKKIKESGVWPREVLIINVIILIHLCITIMIIINLMSLYGIYCIPSFFLKTQFVSPVPLPS